VRVTTPAEKKAILGRLYRVWMRVPDMSIGAVISTFIGPLNNLYGMTAETFIHTLETKIPNGESK